VLVEDVRRRKALNFRGRNSTACGDGIDVVSDFTIVWDVGDSQAIIKMVRNASRNVIYGLRDWVPVLPSLQLEAAIAIKGLLDAKQEQDGEEGGKKLDDDWARVTKRQKKVLAEKDGETAEVMDHDSA
jgi:hypothetical protein